MNKVAVITGASKGIGAATARAFSDAGYNVVINYLDDDKAADEVAKTIKTDVITVKADVSTEAGAEELLEAVKGKFGKIDVLVNNVGTSVEPAFGDLSYADIIKSVDGNFTSAVLCTKAFVPIINMGGCIIFTSSIYGMNQGGNVGIPIYSAQKAAIVNFAQTMAEKLAPNIRCNSVSPGPTHTPVYDRLPVDYVNMRKAQTLQGELVQPEEIAAASLFLATTPHANATNITVDAGWMKKFPEKR